MFLSDMPAVLFLADEGGPPSWMTLVPIAVIFIMMMFFLQQPQKRERLKREAMLKNLKKNDRVITVGGVYGVVTNVQQDTNEITIRVDETNNTRLRITFASVATVLGDDAVSTDAKEPK